jgi:hypothetical protein
MDYLGGRQNALKEIPVSELNAMLSAVVEAFGEDWLKAKGNNPVQILWNRRDALATNELLLLGNAIRVLRQSHPKWVKRQVGFIIKAEVNNRRGALFELLALSLFEGTVTPSVGSNPGYDGTVRLPAGGSIQVSIKSHGLSPHQQNFKKKCEDIERFIAAGLEQRHINRLTILLGASQFVDSQTEYSKLKRAIPNVLDDIRGMPEPYFKVYGISGTPWTISVASFPKDCGPLSTNHISYTFIAICPYHRNERKRLFDKLDEACSNFKKAGNLPDKFTRLIFIDIPESASITLCKEWVEQYFSENSSTTVGAILLYQPTVASAMDGSTSQIKHCVNIILGPEYGKWAALWPRGQALLEMAVLVGSVSFSPAPLMITNGKKQIPIDGQYIYQQGQHFVLSEVKGDGTIVGRVENIASGISVHCVMSIPGQAGELLLKGVFPPHRELLLW